MAACSASDAPVLPLVASTIVAAAGVQVLALHVDVGGDSARDMVELHDRRVADGLGDVCERALHHGNRPSSKGLR
jgi:hypothetical protein